MDLISERQRARQRLVKRTFVALLAGTAVACAALTSFSQKNPPDRLAKVKRRMTISIRDGRISPDDVQRIERTCGSSRSPEEVEFMEVFFERVHAGTVTTADGRTVALETAALEPIAALRPHASWEVPTWGGLIFIVPGAIVGWLAARLGFNVPAWLGVAGGMIAGFGLGAVLGFLDR